MAKRIVETLIDDLTGKETEDGRTVPFSIDGNDYEIDLSVENIDGLLDALKPYREAGRRVAASGAAPRKTRAKSSIDLKAARAWLREQGHEVSNRGRIHAHLLEEYIAATK